MLKKLCDHFNRYQLLMLIFYLECVVNIDCPDPLRPACISYTCEGQNMVLYSNTNNVNLLLSINLPFYVKKHKFYSGRTNYGGGGVTKNGQNFMKRN